MTRIKNMLKHAKKNQKCPLKKKAVSRTAAGARSQKNGEISNKQDTLVILEIFKAKILKLLLIYLKKVIFVSKLYKIL